MLRQLGMLLIGIGVLALIAYLGYYYVTLFLLNPEVPLILRLAITVIPLGLLLVLISLARERLRERGRDKFEGIRD